MPRHRRTKQSLIAVLLAVGACAGILALRNAVVEEPLERLRAEPAGGGRAVYTGTWHFPRGGPYRLGFESPAPASLSIEGRVVAKGAGEQKRRLVYQPGDYAVRFEAPPGARLLWHPPGRVVESSLEYVPASSLSPEPPEEASFGPGAGASRLDGLFAVGLLAVLARLAVFLLRDRLRRIDRRTAAWFAAVFAVALGLRLFDLGAAGQTWDEDTNWSAGRNYVVNVLSLDFRQASWRWNLEHPPVMKYVAGLGALFADGYGPARALSGLMVALACALLVPIGARLFSLRVGALAGAFAALTPHLIAHSKVVGHEAPTVLLWTLGVWAALRAHDAGDERLPGRLVLVGVVFGLAISSRFVNGLLAPLLGAVLLLQAPHGERKRTVLLGFTLVPAVAIATAVALWPRLWSEPIAHLQQSWEVLKSSHMPEPFLGELTNRPPRSYFLVYLLVTAPLGILAAAGAYVARAVGDRRPLRVHAVVFLWLLVPMIVALSPVRQDGVRYVMPSLVALSLAAAAGLDFVAASLGRWIEPARRFAFPALAGAALVYLTITCARIHPYYLDYYGEQVGGPAQVAEARQFEIAWWGEGLAEALDVLNREAEEGARVYKGCVAPAHLAWLRGDLWATEARRPERADWILVYGPTWFPKLYPDRCEIPEGAELVYQVSAQGAPLARLYRR